MSGNGVSDSVRNHICVWVSVELMQSIYPVYQQAGGKLTALQLASKMKESDEWKRQSRKKTGSGFVREYYSDALGGKTSKVKLLVHSPKTDYSANSYVFTVDGKPIAGGKTKLQSVMYSTTVKDKPKVEIYSKFSPEELQKIETQMQYGDGFADLEFERTV